MQTEKEIRTLAAIAAMQGLLSQDNGAAPNGGNWVDHPDSLAQWSVKVADALVKELGK